MKKVILCLAASLFVALGIYAQESKPVIGLTEIGFVNGQTVPQDYKNVEIQVRAAFSSSIVNTRRFAVMERSAEELDKIRRENIETSGAINSNSQLDFMLTGEITAYEATTTVIPLVLANVEVPKFKLAINVKFTDVHTGQIVISEVVTKETSGQGIKVDQCAKELSDAVMAKIINKLYPPIVLSVKKAGNVIQTVNMDYDLGDVLEVYKNGEEMFDPYTGGSIGFEEETVAFVVVFEINSTTNIVKAAPIPKEQYEKAPIEKGFGVRAKKIMKGKKEITENNKKALKKFQAAGIMK